jgi:cell division protein FtsB
MGFFSKIVGAAAPILGGIVGGPAGAAVGAGIGGAFASQDSQDFSSAEAVASRAYTTEQLQNRHQWEVADLRKAGLNPILSAMKGAPSIGGSAQASSNANAAQDASSLLSSAIQAEQLKLNNEKLQAEIDLLNSQSSKAKAEARNTTNIGNISQNLGNLSSGFHGLTSSTSKSIDKTLSETLDDIKNIPQYFKNAVKRNKEKGVYNWDRYKFWKKGN